MVPVKIDIKVIPAKIGPFFFKKLKFLHLETGNEKVRGKFLIYKRLFLLKVVLKSISQLTFKKNVKNVILFSRFHCLKKKVRNLSFSEMVQPLSPTKS